MLHVGLLEGSYRMSSHPFIAHTREDGTEQLLIDHLLSTAVLARVKAEPWGGELAYLCGLLHDVGKYSVAFQARIRGDNRRVDHATGGGQLITGASHASSLSLFAAYCVMGHHGGIPNGGSSIHDSGQDTTLHGRLKRCVEPYDAYKNELVIPPLQSFSQQWEDGFDAAFFVRMVYSALVDADWLDTEEFCENGNAHRGGFLALNEINELLKKHVEKLLYSEREISALNQKRNELLRDCLDAAKKPGGLFTLTAPTGSGKTISSLAFAINHCIHNKKRRVIYIVPYNTIIDQNALVFEELIGTANVLRHYSDASYDGDDPEVINKRSSIENWDYPLIITSSVQFFESLFSNKPSKCRKLHNIANSVLIFDEAQIIPLPYLQPIVRTIKTLVSQYNCTAVLATATQSSLNAFFKPLLATEIVREPQALYDSLRRSAIEQINKPLSDEELTNRLLSQKQVLCIVNTRRHAQELFSGLHSVRPTGAFHLSTTMYPSHRKRILDTIRKRLKDGKECRVISTSLIEAGVDLDFVTVYRELSGLDSILQAAGRCNREGKRSWDTSIVYVFISAEHRTPCIIQPNVDACRLATQLYADISELKTIKSYFEQLYYVLGNKQLDTQRIIETLNDGAKAGMSFPFKDVAEAFNFIDNTAQKTLYALHEAPELETRVRRGERSRDLFRAIGAYGISLYEHDINELRKIGAIEQPDALDESVILLAFQQYKEDIGVSLTPEGGQALIV